MRTHLLFIITLTLNASCGDSSAATGGGGTSPSGGSGTGASSSEGGGGGEAPGDCAPPASAFPHPPPATCLPGAACADDTDCAAGSRCNTELSPPQCEDLYCGGPGTFCSDDVFCEEGLECAEGLCSSCDLCGTTLCSIDFMNDLEHCGCCNNPAVAPAICVGGVIQCPSGEATCESIFPLAVGYSWTYEVEALGNSTCDGTETAEVLGAFEQNDRTEYEVGALCSAGSLFYAVEDDSILINRAAGWTTLFGAPIQAGSTWLDGDLMRTWQEEGTVTVQAGTFDDCWRVLYEENADRYTILCRGVGRVRDYAGGNGYDIELVSKNF